MDGIALSIFASRLSSICDEMGAVLQRAALSPNIKDRLDYSCAIFDAAGELCAQAAHIPVHLGSMAYAMRDVVRDINWRDGAMIVVNDPFLGGTHVPDVTIIAPLFVDGALVAFVANRAHHANIGAATPGSMPLSTSVHDEGLVLAPQVLVENGVWNESLMQLLAAATGKDASTRADFAAQVSANRAGVARLQALVRANGHDAFCVGIDALNEHGAQIASKAVRAIPSGVYTFTDFMDDDGFGACDLPIVVTLRVEPGHIAVDFSGTAPQTPGNINCPLSVAAAAVYYVLRCLMPPHTPTCAGAFRCLTLTAPAGCLVNARYPAAVAAGNVETSTRIVDALLGALAQAVPQLVPAASQGSMNNVALGARDAAGAWDYYETIGGGMGASGVGPGVSVVQTHMTNTLNTPIESLEMHYPLRVTQYEMRRGSGGAGRHNGGDGLLRGFRFLRPATVTLLTERRRRRPWGLAGGTAGLAGENRLDGILLPGKTTFTAQPGQTLTIATPGGGGWGASAP